MIFLILNALQNISKGYIILEKMIWIKKNIIGEFKDWKYNFETVSEKFHLIEENTRIVFIPIEQEAKDLLFEIKNRGYGKARMRKASQYCVQIYNQLLILCMVLV